MAHRVRHGQREPPAASLTRDPTTLNARVDPMARSRRSLVYVGIKNQAMAFDRRYSLKGLGTGLITIATDLGGSSAGLPAHATHQQMQAAASTAATTAAI